MCNCGDCHRTETCKAVDFEVKSEEVFGKIIAFVIDCVQIDDSMRPARRTDYMQWVGNLSMRAVRVGFAQPLAVIV